MKFGYKVRISVLVLIIFLAAVGCQEINTSDTIPTSSKLSPTPLPIITVRPITTEILRQSPVPTATDIQLPYNLVSESSEYCQPPYALLPGDEAIGLTDDEIGYKLIDIWLSRYKKAEAHPYCRIEDFLINQVYYDKRTTSLPLEPKGDFTLVADFSIKLIQTPTNWLSFSGTLDQNNWFHIIHDIAIFKIDNGYSMEFAYP